jgi:aminoglycoside phosphotransferase (APT) family kinase protein
LKGLTRSAFAAGTPEALSELSAYIDKTAVGLAELHASGVTSGATVAWADVVADVEQTVDRAASVAPELIPAAAPLLTRLQEQAGGDPPDALVPTHGSFRPNQVLLNAGDIGFIDFDRFGQAEPALDIASFRTAVRDAGRLDADPDAAESGDDDRRARIEHLDELCDRFLDGYAARVPVSRERVRLWEALGLFTTVLNSWTKMEAGLAARLELLLSYLQASGLG